MAEPISTMLLIAAWKATAAYLTSHGITAASVTTVAAGSALFTAAAGVVYISYVTAQNVVSWFSKTLTELRNNTKSNNNAKFINATLLGKVSNNAYNHISNQLSTGNYDVVDAGLSNESIEYITSSEFITTKADKIVVQLIAERLENGQYSVVSCRLIKKIDTLDQNLLNAHQNKSIVVWI
jgi:hypothetical protein